MYNGLRDPMSEMNDSTGMNCEHLSVDLKNKLNIEVFY